MPLILSFLALLAGAASTPQELAPAPAPLPASRSAFPVFNTGIRSFAFAVDGPYVAFTDADAPGVFLYDADAGRVVTIGSSGAIVGTDHGRVLWTRTTLHVYDTASGTDTDTGLVAGGTGTAVAARGDDGWIAYEVRESLVGDLTGDGDILDGVVIVVDPDGHTVGAPLAVTGGSPYLAEDGIIGIAAREFFQGHDLNGDGDLADTVLHVVDRDGGTLVVLGAFSGTFDVLGGLLFFTANGTLHAYDPIAKTTATLGLPVTLLPVAAGERFGVSVQETSGNDRNGDGDTTDRVLYLWDPRAGTLENVGVALGATLVSSGGTLVAGVSEAAEGGEDLNGDGDADDQVCHVVDATTGETWSLGLACGSALGGARVALSASDLSDSTEDRVFVIYDPATGALTNTRRGVGSYPALLSTQAGSHFALAFREASELSADLNGDGDVAIDQVVHVLRDGQWVSTGLAGDYYILGEDLLALLVREQQQGQTDLNGDGDAVDQVLFVIDLR